MSELYGKGIHGNKAGVKKAGGGRGHQAIENPEQN